MGSFILNIYINLLIVLYFAQTSRTLDSSIHRSVSAKNSFVWGPGLKNTFFLPVRYFYIQAVDQYHVKYNKSAGEKAFSVNMSLKSGDRVQMWTQVLDRHDGSYIVRYRAFRSLNELMIVILHQGNHVAESPYYLTGPVYHEKCDCPQPDIVQWFEDMDCPKAYTQIEKDLAIFKKIDFKKVSKTAVERFTDVGQHSIAHYKIIDNKIYRKTYGEHVGFKIFSDATLLSITRKVKLPDMEFFVNFGDWPLEKRPVDKDPIPIFSWCGSDNSRDIVMPTYDITEATIEMMSRVSLDIFSVQANTGPQWEDKEKTLFWRGRDSREERLKVVEMSRRYPEKINASLTNMFFFPKNEEKYGKIVKSISFFDFFKHKYQLNIDGTVAAYRLPYLLGGDSVVLKQESPFYEHFYHNLKPWKHYIPFERDLSDLMEKIDWALANDEKAKEIGRNAQNFIRQHLNPSDIYCYHVKLFQEYAKLLMTAPKASKGFEYVAQGDTPDSKCDCQKYKTIRDEL